MNSSLTEILSSLLFLVVQSVLPAVMPNQQLQLEAVSLHAEVTASSTDTTSKVRTSRKRVSHTPYYDFGRRHTRAKD